MIEKDIYIIGSGGFAKEVFWLIKDINNYTESSSRYIFKGFITNDKDITEITISNKSYKVIYEDIFLSNSKKKKICIAPGIGNPLVLSDAIEKYLNKYEFPNLIHPTYTGNNDDIKMGIGNIITSGCIFTTGINIGSFNIFNLNTTVGHDVIVGSYNVINPGSNISGGVVICDCNLIGTNSTILQYIKIGNKSIIGAGSVVTKNVEDNVVVIGVPAKVLKYNK